MTRFFVAGATGAIGMFVNTFAKRELGWLSRHASRRQEFAAA